MSRSVDADALNLARLQAHPKVRSIEHGDGFLVVALSNGDTMEFYGGLDTAIAEALIDLDGEDA